MQPAADKLTRLAPIPAYAFFCQHRRIPGWPAEWILFVVLFIGPDLCRLRVRWLRVEHP